MKDILNTVCSSAVACVKCVKDEVCDYWASLDENTVVNKQDLVLAGAALVAAGLVIGAVCGSKKEVIVTVSKDAEEDEEVQE